MRKDDNNTGPPSAPKIRGAEEGSNIGGPPDSGDEGKKAFKQGEGLAIGIFSKADEQITLNARLLEVESRKQEVVIRCRRMEQRCSQLEGAV